MLCKSVCLGLTLRYGGCTVCSIWDILWVLIIITFIVSLIPGLLRFPMRAYPNHWAKIKQGATSDMTAVSCVEGIYSSASYHINTPLQYPMPSFFYFHIIAAFGAGVILLLQMTSGRTIRWGKTQKVVQFAQGVHSKLGYLSIGIWVIIVITGGMSIRLLHPTFQVLNSIELVAVTSLLILTVVSAWKGWWALHRISARGLVYSAGTSVVIACTGNIMQHILLFSVYDTKLYNYGFAFIVPAIGICFDIAHELYNSHEYIIK